MPKNTPNRARHTTKQTIARTNIAIATWPKPETFGPGLSHEVELVKAAVLYADSVELLSPAHQIVRDLQQLSDGPSTNLIQVMNSLGDDTLRNLGVANPSDVRGVVSALAQIDPAAIRAFEQMAPDAGPLGEFAEKVEDFHAQLGSSMNDFRTVVDDLRRDSGVAEIEPALKRGIVRLNDRIPVSKVGEEMVKAVTREIERYLRDPQKLVVLDNEMASLTTSLIEAGMLKPASRAMANAGEAAVGTGLIARLPAFPSAPVDEILNLRDDLIDPLTRYRRAAGDLRTKLLLEPFDPDFDGEIDAIWRTEVAPELVAVREAMAQHGLVREVLRFIGSNPKALVAGLYQAGLTVYFGAVGSVQAAVVTGASALITAGAPAVKQALERDSQLAPTKRSDLFYLYELDKRL